MTDRALPSDLMHESKVMEKYGHLFSERELRQARKGGQIGWYDLRKGPHYTDAQIMEYLSRRERLPCQQDERADHGLDETPPTIESLSSEATGSKEKSGLRSSRVAGMTPDLERYAADRLASKT